MELRQLHYFLAAARHLNFTEAAQECFIVQSAMSQQIQALEKELGVTLFTRANRTLRLTREGELFRDEASRILAQVGRSTQLVRDLSKGVQKILRFGCHGDLMREQLPKVLGEFRQQAPHIHLQVQHGRHDDLMRALQNGHIDCFLTVQRKDFALAEWIGFKTVAENRMHAMVPARHPLSGRTCVTKAELAHEPMILLSGSDHTPRLVDWAADAAPMNVYGYADCQRSIESMVAAGYGLSLCLESACRVHPGIAYPLLDVPTEKLSLVWNRTRTPDGIELLLSLFLIDASKTTV